MAAVPQGQQNHMHQQMAHDKQLQADSHDLGCTLIEDNLDTAEDNTLGESKSKSSTRFALAKSGLFAHPSVARPASYYHCKAASRFVPVRSFPSHIYIIHRVLRI